MHDGFAPRAGFVILCAFTVAVAGVGLLAAPALAGDAVAQFDLGQPEQSAEPGETVTVDVHLRSDGGYADEGIESYSFVVAIPPEVGEPATDVEPGPWLAQDGGEVEQTVTSAGEGAIRVHHERTDADDGVTGAGVAATVTIGLRENAPAADASVLVADPAANLIGNDYPMQTFGDEGSIVVGGGGEEIEPAYEPGSGSGDGSVGVVTANESNRSVDSEAGDDESDTDADGTTPGFGIGVGAFAVLIWALLAGSSLIGSKFRGSR